MPALCLQLFTEYCSKTYNRFMLGADTFEDEDAEYLGHLSKSDLHICVTDKLDRVMISVTK